MSCCELRVSFTREHKAPFDQEPRASGVRAQEGLRLHSRRVCGEQSPGRAQGPAPAVPQDLWQGSEQSRGRGTARLSMTSSQPQRTLSPPPSAVLLLLLAKCPHSGRGFATQLSFLKETVGQQLLQTRA